MSMDDSVDPRELCIEHLEKVSRIVRLIKSFMDAYSDNDEERFRGIFDEIFRLEREADMVKGRIIKHISIEPMHPMDRMDILRFIMTVDDIASYGKGATRKLLHVDPEYVPENIKGDLVKLSMEAIREIESLIKAYESIPRSRDDALRHADQVERMEEEIDELKEKIITRVIWWGDQIGSISRWLLVKEAVDYLEEMADRIEDAADIVRGMAVAGSGA